MQKTTRPGPLSGLRVLAIEQFGAGPWTTLQLADLGAEVIKIEDPRSRGDVGRYVPPFRTEDSSLFFEAFNRGKRSILLDLRIPAARTVLEDLARDADGLFANLRGSSFVRLRLRHADFAHVNPRIVCCSLSGFGTTGPRAPDGAYDHVIQALAGWMSLTGGPDDPPTRSGVSLADFSAGYAATGALLAGILHARTTGVGCDCDVSLYEAALAQLNYLATWTLSRDYAPRRHAASAHPSIVPFQAYRTADGRIVIAAPKDSLWRSLVAALDDTDIADDSRFQSFEGRLEHRDVLNAMLEGQLARRPTADWIARLGAAGVPCAEVRDVREAFADPQVEARGLVQEIDHPELGPIRHVRGALRTSVPGPDAGPAPRLGEHTESVLRTICGYDTGRIAELRSAAVFGD